MSAKCHWSTQNTRHAEIITAIAELVRALRGR